MPSHALLLVRERNKLQKELYDLRKAVYDLEDENKGWDWEPIDRLMGDWTPEKE